MKWFKNKAKEEAEEIEKETALMQEAFEKIRASYAAKIASPPIITGTPSHFPGSPSYYGHTITGSMSDIRMQAALHALAGYLGLKDADEVYKLIEEIRYRGDVT